MKNFFHRYSYDSMRMFLSQIAIGIFGLTLSLVSVKAEKDGLILWTSIGSVAFYLFLIYDTAWRCGSKDHESIDLGKMRFRPFTGTLISLLANSLNILLALLLGLLVLSGAARAFDIVRFLAGLIHGVYQGLLSVIPVGNEQYLASDWWAYLITPLPALIVSTLGYIAGARDFMITRLGVPDYPASDRPTRRENRERKAKEKARKQDDQRNDG